MHVVRYEDLKFYPSETIQALLGFLNLSISDKRIDAATQASSFFQVKEKEEAVISNKTSARIFRKGLVGEWIGILDEESVALIGEQANYFLRRLKYDTLSISVSRAVTFIGMNETTAYAAQACGRSGIAPLAVIGHHALPPEVVTYTDTARFSPLHLYREIIGPCVVAEKNKEILRSVMTRCQIAGWPCIVPQQDDCHPPSGNLFATHVIEEIKAFQAR